MIVDNCQWAGRKKVGGYVKVACISSALGKSCSSETVSRDVGEGCGEDTIFSGVEGWGPVMLVRVVATAA